MSYSLFKWPIRRTDEVGGKKLAISKPTELSLCKTTTQFVFPLVLLLNLASAGHEQYLPMLLQKFNVMLSPDENERNSLGIFAMKCSALSEKDGLVPLGRLFPLEKWPN